MILCFAEQAKWWPVRPKLMDIYRDGSHTEQDQHGTLRWHKDNLLHRDNDKPALIWPGGPIAWYKNGLRHRDDDKPALIGEEGSLYWFKNDLLHRVCGPAMIHSKSKIEWWINDKNITKEVEDWLRTCQYKYPFTAEQQIEFMLTFA